MEVFCIQFGKSISLWYFRKPLGSCCGRKYGLYDLKWQVAKGQHKAKGKGAGVAQTHRHGDSMTMRSKNIDNFEHNIKPTHTTTLLFVSALVFFKSD